ncbi:helix-turn-helix transcriptional regulator [Roseivivax sp. CAU 1761]
MTKHCDFQSRVGDLRGQIMSAILGEVRWEDFLDTLRDFLPNGAATLFYHDASRDRGAFSLASGMDPAALRSYADHYCALNPWMAAATRRPIGVAVPDSAMFDRAALLKTEFYNDYLRPNDLQGAIGVTITRKEECHFFLSVLGDVQDTQSEREALAALRALVPDLRRAFEFYQRRPAPNAAEAERPGAGTMVLGPRRSLRASSGEALRQLELGRVMSVGPTGRVSFRDKHVADRIDACLAAPCVKPTGSGTHVLLVADPPGMPLKLTVMAWPWAEGMRYFRGPECLVLLEALGAGDPDLAEFARLFGLTARETEVAAALLAGLSTQDIASNLGVTFETVRSYLRAPFAKTGTCRQPQLVSLVARCAV